LQVVDFHQADANGVIHAAYDRGVITRSRDEEEGRLFRIFDLPPQTSREFGALRSGFAAGAIVAECEAGDSAAIKLSGS
jgi:hypothetical protein